MTEFTDHLNESINLCRIAVFAGYGAMNRGLQSGNKHLPGWQISRIHNLSRTSSITGLAASSRPPAAHEGYRMCSARASTATASNNHASATYLAVALAGLVEDS